MRCICCGKGTYYMPEGFSMGKLDDWSTHSEWIMDDANSTEPMNVKERVDAFVRGVLPLAQYVRGNDVMLTMGGDFDWNHGALAALSPTRANS